MSNYLPIAIQNKQSTSDQIDNLLGLFDRNEFIFNLEDLSDGGFIDKDITRETTRFNESFTSNTNVAAYIRKLRKTYYNLPDTKEELMDPDHGYQFPNEEFIDNYRVQTRNVDRSNYINESEDNIKNSLYDYIANPDLGRDVSVVTGKVGSGKSTFLHYLDRCYSSDLLEKKVFYCKVKYTASEIEKKEFDDINKWENYFEKKFINSSVYEVLKNQGGELDDIIDGFLEYSSESISLVEIDEKIIESTGRLSEKIINVTKKKSSIIPMQTIAKMNMAIKCLLIEYMADKGYVFLIVIDGFDVFSMEEISSSNQQGAFSVLAKVISGRFSYGNLSNSCFMYLITLRACTYEMFMDWYSENNRDHEINTFSLVPVGIRKILYSRALRHKHLEELEEDNISYFITDVIQVVKQRFSLEYDDNMVSLFNENYRRLIDFVLDVILFYASKIVYEENIEKFQDFIESFGHKDLIEKHLKSQSLVEVLLMSKYSNYSNYFTFNNSDLSVKRSGSMDARRGYVDNIFNYTPVMQNGSIPYYLIKVRIVQTLSSSSTHLKACQVIEKLELLGYTMSDDIFEHYIRLLISIGFVRPRLGLDGELSYNSTRKGDFVVNSLINEIRYSENTIQSSIFPKVLLKHLAGARKYASTIEDHVMSINNWICVSIVNNFIHTQFIKRIEHLEKRQGYPANQSFEVGRGKWSVYISIEEIKNAIRHIVSNPVSGTNSYVNCGYLCEKINLIIKDWREINK